MQHKRVAKAVLASAIVVVAAAGCTVAGGNGSGSGADQLNHPNGVAVDAAGNVYISDIANQRIQKWAPGA